MKAFIVRETYGDGCCVQFAEHNVVARREGANELNTEFGAVEVNRYPAFDEYAATGVPDAVLVEHGWWFMCMHCGQKIEADPTDADGEPIELEPVYGTWVFCRPSCEAEFKAERLSEEARGEMAATLAMHKWPGITVTHKNGYEHRVGFRFPGGQDSVDWRIGQHTVWVTKRDVPAFERFQSQIHQQR